MHIPFCVRKCRYCDFLSAPAGRQEKEAYVTALGQEIRDFAKRNGEVLSSYEVASVFFGGGTPSLLASEELTGILKVLRECFCFRADVEVTVECNPKTLTEEKLAGYRREGVNRLSIGLQSADDHELSLLGRIHTWEDFCSTYALVRKMGFDNVNVDLMSALPGQTLASYGRTLRQVLALSPEHISAYSLIIEEGTPFYEVYGGESGKGADAHAKDALGRGMPFGAEPLPDEDTEREMYALTGELLEKAGYCRYEISNYALPGRECRHNICYWERTEYIGFGLGAASLFMDTRFSNERELAVYLGRVSRGEDVYVQTEPLSVRERMEEFMFLGLRMMRGVSRKEFLRQFGRGMNEVYGTVLKKYLAAGLLFEDGDRVFLTGRGIDVSNAVLCDFLLDEER